MRQGSGMAIPDNCGASGNERSSKITVKYSKEKLSSHVPALQRVRREALFQSRVPYCDYYSIFLTCEYVCIYYKNKSTLLCCWIAFPKTIGHGVVFLIMVGIYNQAIHFEEGERQVTKEEESIPYLTTNFVKR